MRSTALHFVVLSVGMVACSSDMSGPPGTGTQNGAGVSGTAGKGGPPTSVTPTPGAAGVTGAAGLSGTAGTTSSAGASGSTGVSPPSPASSGCQIVPGKTGWIDGAANDAKVQGAVYTYVGKDSMITPSSTAAQPFTTAGDGKICVKGTASKVQGMDYAAYFGAAVGFDVCHAAPTDPMPTAKYTLGTCPTGSKLVGLGFKITGATVPSELRVVFHEEGRDESTYVLASAGANKAMFADGKILYKADAPPGNPAKIDAVHFLIPTNTMAAVPFDFCIENIEPFTKGGSCDQGNTGAGGAGGTTPVTPVGALSGTLPTNVSPADVRSAYDAWKSTYVKSCPDKGLYVANPQDNGAAYSEGIGYGMLLAVANDDRATFDGLWKFYGVNAAGNDGLMNWRAAGCGAVSGTGSAADGDLDAAMALVQASCRWTGTYGADATTLINKMKARLVVAYGGLQVLKPGNRFSDPSCVNPSYFSPGYYRVFARHAQDPSWNQVATDTYKLFEKLAHATTGLVPNWGHTDGAAPHGECARPEAGIYGYDAARTPWRVAVDYRFWGDASAKTLLTKHVAWAKGAGIGSLGDKYNVDGSQVHNFHTPVTVGAFANATVVSDRATADDFYQALKAVTVNEYFPVTLKALYLTLGAGLFDRCVK